MVVGVLLITIAIVAAAASIPFQAALPLKSPFLKLSWRQMNMLPFLFAMAAIQVYLEKDFSLKSVFKWSLLKRILLIAFIGDLMSLFGVFAGTYTIMSHVQIFSNMSGALIVLHAFLSGRAVHRFEVLGTLIALGGCLITVTDPQAQKVDRAQENILLGDFLAFMAAIFSAFYYTANQALVHQLPPFLAISMVMLASQGLLQAFGVLFVAGFDLTCNPETGSFGFVNVDYLGFVVFGLGFLSGACNYGCSFQALRYVSPLVLCTALLFTPFVGQAFGVMLGLDQMPGAVTVVGTTVSMGGLYFVAVGGSQKAASE